MKAALSTGLWALLTLGTATAAPCEPPRHGAVEAAKGLHRAAEVHFHAGRYAQAVDAWRLAYELDCQAHRLLINIGNAEARRGNGEAAIAAYERYLEREQDGETEAPVRARLAELHAAASSEIAPALGEPAVETKVAPFVVAGVVGPIAAAGLVLVGVGVAEERDAEKRCPDLFACPRRTLDARDWGLTMQQAGGGLAAFGFAVAGGALLYGFFAEEGPVVPAIGLGSASVTITF
jgi:tetratricopeptide (TPR) repeat protein